MKRWITMGVAAAAGALALAACATSGTTANPTGGSSPATGNGTTVALILPDATTSTRWDSQDRPAFEAAMAELSPDTRVIAASAATDADQLQAAEAALLKGANVIVVNPITSEGAGALVAAAHRGGAKVIAYDGLITGTEIDGYVSFGNQKVGELQAQYIVDKVDKGAKIAMINGEQNCDSCIAFKVGSHAILDPLVKDGTLKIVFEADTPGWLAATAQTETEQMLTAQGDDIDAVLVANDGMSQGVVAALKGRGLNGKVIVTGQDATITGLQDIVLGNQTMTVYKDMREEAKAAARMAIAFLTNTQDSFDFTDSVNNGAGSVSSILLDPSVVDRSNIAELIASGFVSRDDVCTGDVASACDF